MHFLLLGGFIYLFYSLNAEDQTVTPKQPQQQIFISQSEISELKRSYENEFHQKPDARTLSALVKQAIEKKVLLQEAYGLELYKNDKEIEKILLKKMHFIINAPASQTQPDETQLKAYYQTNIKDYSQRESISFCTIHFDSLSKKAQEDFYQILLRSEQKPACNLEKKQSKEQIEKKYGNYFTNKIFQAKKATWLPALPSKTGIEFVYINEYETKEPYPFEEVEERVYQDFQTQQKQENYKKTRKQMRSSYTIQVQK